MLTANGFKKPDLDKVTSILKCLNISDDDMPKLMQVLLDAELVDEFLYACADFLVEGMIKG